jgi:hypothetical protein
VANIIVVVDKNRDFVLCGCFRWVAEKYMWPKSIWPSLSNRPCWSSNKTGLRDHALDLLSALQIAPASHSLPSGTGGKNPPTAGQLAGVFELDDHRWTVQYHNTHDYRSSIALSHVACTYDHQASVKLPDNVANSFGKHPIPRHLGSRQLPAQFRYL